jgi:predicted DNA-binding transcriptional regulator AlpA/DNA-binding CsgD family transcriptional regulator
LTAPLTGAYRFAIPARPANRRRCSRWAIAGRSEFLRMKPLRSAAGAHLKSRKEQANRRALEVAALVRQGLTYKEVGARMGGISAERVSQLLHRAYGLVVSRELRDEQNPTNSSRLIREYFRVEMSNREPWYVAFERAQKHKADVNDDPIISLAEVVKVVGRSAATIRRHEKAGKFPARHRQGRQAVWFRSEIIAYLEWLASREDGKRCSAPTFWSA